MKVGIMQPYLFPYLGYFQLINAVDEFILLDDVNFINKGYINKNAFLLNGKPHSFTFPIEKASQNKLINELHFSANIKERQKFLKTLKMAYQKAPHFNEVYPMIEEIALNDASNVSDFLYQSIVKISRYLNIETTIAPTSSIFDKGELKGQDRILDIVKTKQADNYINPIGGTELYDKGVFSAEGIDLHFIKMHPISYPQLKNEFVPFLSIIDVMMFNNKEQLSILLSSFDLT